MEMRAKKKNVSGKTPNAPLSFDVLKKKTHFFKTKLLKYHLLVMKVKRLKQNQPVCEVDLLIILSFPKETISNKWQQHQLGSKVDYFP